MGATMRRRQSDRRRARLRALASAMSSACGTMIEMVFMVGLDAYASVSATCTCSTPRPRSPQGIKRSSSTSARSKHVCKKIVADPELAANGILVAALPIADIGRDALALLFAGAEDPERRFRLRLRGVLDDTCRTSRASAKARGV